MSWFFPLNANDDVREATRSARILVRALMISSATPSVKYSFSGSALIFTNGNTAIDFVLAVATLDVVIPGGVLEPGAFSACENWAAVGKRTAASFASACTTTGSSHSGRSPREPRSGGGGSVKHCAMIAWAVGPVNGVRPESIS